MRCLALIAALALGASSVAPAQEPAEPALQQPLGPELLEMENERHERLTVSVTIGDRGPFRFLIDTGAQATVLSRELADSLGLFDRRPVTLIGMASRAATHTVAIHQLGIGQRRTNVARAPLVEGRHLGGADGVLGIDALQGQRILLDFAEQRMTIATPEEAKRTSGYEIVVRARPRHGQLIITDAQIEGIRTAIVIDTGAQVSVGNAALARRLRSREGTPAELTDINGTIAQGLLHVADHAKIGELELKSLPIVFTPSPAFHALELEDRPAMILGMRELRLFPRIAIDFDTRRILFDLPSSKREMAEAWARFRES